MATRNGKIARLPGAVREELNRRMFDGEQGEALLGWLNEHPAAERLVESDYEGVPISKENLSQWRQGGYEEWLRQRRLCEMAIEMGERGAEVEEKLEGEALSDRWSVVLVLELMDKVDDLMARDIDATEKSKGLLEIATELCRIRRVDHRRMKLKMERERWNLERAEIEREKKKKEEEARQEELMKPIKAAKTMNQMWLMWGTHKEGTTVAEYITAVRNGLPLPRISKDELYEAALIAHATELSRGKEGKAEGGAGQSKIQGAQVKSHSNPDRGTGNVENVQHPTGSQTASGCVRPESDERREAA